MPPQTVTYSADQVLATWGAIVMDGRGPDTFCKIERNEDSFKTKVGADGEVVRSRMLNHTGRITITLMATSAANALIQDMLLLDEATSNGAGIWPFMIKDYCGNTLWVAPETWAVKPAPSELAAEAGTREWVFECANLAPPLPAHA